MSSFPSWLDTFDPQYIISETHSFFIYVYTCVGAMCVFFTLVSVETPLSTWKVSSCWRLFSFPSLEAFPPTSWSASNCFLFQDNFATRGIDYDFYPSSEDAQWQEGESDRHNFSNLKPAKLPNWVEGGGNLEFSPNRTHHRQMSTPKVIYPNHFPI